MGKIESYWDKEYPTHIEVPEGYWVFSQNVKYIDKETNENSDSRQP